MIADPHCPNAMGIGRAEGLSLLKIPSEPEFERLRGISIESIRSGEGGRNPNVKPIGPGSRSKTLRYMDPQTEA
jgi:hypothetical protein